MADGRNIHSGQDSGRTLIPDLNIPSSETANRSQEIIRRGTTGRRSPRISIRFRGNPIRKTESVSNSQTEPAVSQDSNRSDLSQDVLPIKKRYRPDEGSMSVEKANQNPGDEQIVPGPGSRRLPLEAYCFHKNLSLSAVSPQDGKLNLTQQEASTIPSCPQMTEDTRDSFRKSTLMVFDKQDTQWRMVLTGYNYDNQILYTLAGEWRRFVQTHGLRHGDSICFYKNFDPRIAADYYYVILFKRRVVRRPSTAAR